MRRLKLLLAGISFISLILTPTLAAADVNDFTITDFVSDQTLSRSDPQGELRIVEDIKLVFTDNNHGILRAIPNRYKNHSLQLRINGVRSPSGAPTQYTTYNSNGNKVLKIGDPNRTVTGAQHYTIDYTVRNVMSFYSDHDELYWDVNGDQWQQTFQRVTVRLHLPPELQQSRDPICYTGAFGSNFRACDITWTKGEIKAATTAPLSANQTLTYVAGFDKDYFQPSTWYETLGEYAKHIIGFSLPVLLIGGGSAWLWWRRGRDPRGRGTIVPQYEAPAGLKPLAVGTLLDFRTDNRDITATIVDLAVRGYLKIIEEKQKKRLRKDSLNYKLQLVKPDFSALDSNEQTLMSELFKDPKPGAEVDLAKSKNKLYKLATKLRKDVKEQLTGEAYLRKQSFSLRWIGRLVALIILILIGSAVFGLALILGTVFGVLLAIPFLLAMPARTAKGVAAREHILGLKMYLNVAEKDRLEKLQGPNAKYADKAAEPVKTVDLFEKLLPYAMVLGVERQWAKQFESLYTTPPDWYSGNWTTFNAAYLAGSLNDGVGSAVNGAFSAPSSSSSSGFSGGSSGGGGGGGGGGGW